MIRERLIATVEEAVEGLGYTFYSGSDQMRGATIREFPAAWLSPLKITSVDGHSDCRAVYHLSIDMLMLGSLPHLGHEAVWQILECDSLTLYHMLSQNQWVSEVSGFRCVPLQKALTKCGDVAVCTEMDVETFYCL